MFFHVLYMFNDFIWLRSTIKNEQDLLDYFPMLINADQYQSKSRYLKWNTSQCQSLLISGGAVRFTVINAAQFPPPQSCTSPFSCQSGHPMICHLVMQYWTTLDIHDAFMMSASFECDMVMKTKIQYQNKMGKMNCFHWAWVYYLNLWAVWELHFHNKPFRSCDPLTSWILERRCIWQWISIWLLSVIAV